MSYDEHLISMAGGDGDVLDQIQSRRGGDKCAAHTDCYTSDIEALLAIVREQRAAIERAKAEGWDEGFSAGWAECSDPGAFVRCMGRQDAQPLPCHPHRPGPVMSVEAERERQAMIQRDGEGLARAILTRRGIKCAALGNHTDGGCARCGL